MSKIAKLSQILEDKLNKISQDGNFTAQKVILNKINVLIGIHINEYKLSLQQLTNMKSQLESQQVSKEILSNLTLKVDQDLNFIKNKLQELNQLLYK